MNKHRQILSLAFGVAVMAIAGSAHATTLEDVKARGTLQCGVNSAGLLGFAAADDQGNWKGFDVDYRKAVAAAVFAMRRK
jgi:general L-amino acid transport system substrate-binding protein